MDLSLWGLNASSGSLSRQRASRAEPLTAAGQTTRKWAGCWKRFKNTFGHHRLILWTSVDLQAPQNGQLLVPWPTQMAIRAVEAVQVIKQRRAASCPSRSPPPPLLIVSDPF
ncbi:unnamed protein product [Pleuronectes platessa]|uniref:Uncharacterized protein n=1 Tax=Pleuronectes platessa TaxID=8262 RepID=A0A9N7YMI0_PLEPL|nr:unnamed protein product [Pleuronectes platessa]